MRAVEVGLLHWFAFYCTKALTLPTSGASLVGILQSKSKMYQEKRCFLQKSVYTQTHNAEITCFGSKNLKGLKKSRPFGEK